MTIFEQVFIDLENDTFRADYIKEGYLNKVSMGFKVHPHQNLQDSLKKT